MQYLVTLAGATMSGMREFDPAVAARLHEIHLQAEAIAAKPDVGEEDVDVLMQLVDEIDQLTGAREERERRARERRYHPPRGRAVDIPPRSALQTWLEKAVRVDPAWSRLWPEREFEPHWAFADPKSPTTGPLLDTTQWNAMLRVMRDGQP